MQISVLGSGSSGNSFYVENQKNNSAILVDAGLSAKQINNRLENLKRTPELIKGIFITHEHTDHIRGVDVLARHFNIPIFATKSTIQNCFLCSNEELITPIKNSETIDIAGMKIEAFSKSHKAADPISFKIKKDKTLSIITDAGFACENIISAVSSSDMLCIESNHDEKMLTEGPYPYFLKRWITSDTGHLSNRQSALCVLEHAPSKLKQVILSHLSQINNTPQLALRTFKSLTKERHDLQLKITRSDRHIETPLFKL